MHKKKNSLTAIIDAATIFGAERYVNNYEKYNNKSYSVTYSFYEDRRLFNEFLHNIVMYDKIIYNCNSIEFLESGMENFIDEISNYAKHQIVNAEVILVLPEDDMSGIIHSICEIVKTTNYKNVVKSMKNKIPWYYSSKKHIDYRLVAKTTKSLKLSDSLIPYILFVYRGMCYLAMANSNKKKNEKKTAYIASPNRIEALTHVIHGDDLKNYKSKREKYSELINHLPLPENGYNFSILKNTLPFENTSKLAMSVSNMHPKTALRHVLDLRKSEKVKNIKSKWLNTFEEQASYVVGAANQTISNSIIKGNLVQKIFVGKSNS